MTESFVIIGAGIAGARAAFALREGGFLGEITLIGEESLLPYERPPLSKQTLIDEPEPRCVAAASDYRSADITLVSGVAVTAIDRQRSVLELSDGQVQPYDRLLLTTGARPRALPGAPANSGRIFTLRTHRDAEAIRRRLSHGVRLVVVGGGFIGLELAATARKLGAEVLVLEGQSRLLSRGVPGEIARFIEAKHRGEGVDIRCAARIASLSEKVDELEVTLETGERLTADLLVAGIGAMPNAELAEQAGLAIDNGIAVDAFLQTSDPAIFAAGDCCSFPLPLYDGRRVRLEAWRNAQDQGIAAAANMLGQQQAYAAVPWFWSDQYDMTLQICGLADGATDTVRREIEGDAFILFHLGDDGRLLAASGIGRGNAVARDIRLAEMLIAARARPDPAALASPETKLKKLLAA